MARDTVKIYPDKPELRGTAEALLLRLWGRDGDRTGVLDPIGDDAVLTAWTSIAGM